MTPTEFRTALDEIGWTQRELARRLGVPEARVRRWGNGMYPVPDGVAHGLGRIVAAYQRLPAPCDWEDAA